MARASTCAASGRREQVPRLVVRICRYAGCETGLVDRSLVPDNEVDIFVNLTGALASAAGPISPVN